MMNETLHFPLLWHGRLLTLAPGLGVPAAVQRVYDGLQIGGGSIASGRQSGGQKYRSWQLSAPLPDRATMLALFAALEALPDVKMLI